MEERTHNRHYCLPLIRRKHVYLLLCHAEHLLEQCLLLRVCRCSWRSPWSRCTWRWGTVACRTWTLRTRSWRSSVSSLLLHGRRSSVGSRTLRRAVESTLRRTRWTAVVELIWRTLLSVGPLLHRRRSTELPTRWSLWATKVLLLLLGRGWSTEPSWSWNWSRSHAWSWSWRTLRSTELLLLRTRAS